MDSLHELVTRVRGVSSGVQLTAATQTADPSPRQLRSLRAALAGYAADLRGLRRDLDSTDVRELLVHEWPEDVIRIWQLERRARRAMVNMAHQIRETDAVAEVLERGARLRQYVTRSGDTWQSVAARLLGDWREWRRLVTANGGDPATLPAGTVLVVPER